ncbi:hypothetical protein CDAR_267981 [Caerostris darwini]|uniref:Uncharacterized protein n=1 Tax=Caerostris darwini TaxID=1538125 RepID=A0AAV4RI22_9ARAC|nr:hypothetical protein CDAR_267981 [Caerostris darwini]
MADQRETRSNYGCMLERFAGQVSCIKFRLTCFSLDPHPKSHTEYTCTQKMERFKEHYCTEYISRSDKTEIVPKGKKKMAPFYEHTWNERRSQQSNF